MKKVKKYVKIDLLQQQSDFLNPLDRGQVKYEMLRAHSLEGHFITRVCKEFGYSRESFYLALEAFRKEGIAGLVNKPKGKTKPDKVTPEIIGYVIYQRAKFGLSGAAIAKKIEKEFDLNLHKRTVERILGYYGILDRVENSLNQSSGKKNDVVPIAAMIVPVNFEEQVHGPDCTNVSITKAMIPGSV